MIPHKTILWLTVAVFALSGTFAAMEAAANEVYVIKVADAISPGVAEFIGSGLQTAQEKRAACVIIELDTPGGLAESMRIIVQDILASRVPVVVYVAPGGARAASAGVMITMAADVAAMSPGTNIGAAHPVGAGGKDIDGKMSERSSTTWWRKPKAWPNSEGATPTGWSRPSARACR